MGRARVGEIADFTGISPHYDIPEQPDFVLETAERSIEDSVSQLFAIVSERTRLR